MKPYVYFYKFLFESLASIQIFLQNKNFKSTDLFEFLMDFKKCYNFIFEKDIISSRTLKKRVFVYHTGKRRKTRWKRWWKNLPLSWHKWLWRSVRIHRANHIYLGSEIHREAFRGLLDLLRACGRVCWAARGLVWSIGMSRSTRGPLSSY